MLIKMEYVNKTIYRHVEFVLMLFGSIKTNYFLQLSLYIEKGE